MGAITFFKTVSAPPAGPTYVEDACYFVRAGVGFDIYVTNSDGTAIHKHNDTTGSSGGATFAEDVLDTDTLVTSPSSDTTLMSVTLSTAGVWHVDAAMLVVGDSGADFEPSFVTNANINMDDRMLFFGPLSSDSTPHSGSVNQRLHDEAATFGTSPTFPVHVNARGIAVSTGADQVLTLQARQGAAGTDITVYKYSWLSARYLGADV